MTIAATDATERTPLGGQKERKQEHQAQHQIFNPNLFPATNKTTGPRDETQTQINRISAVVRRKARAIVPSHIAT